MNRKMEVLARQQNWSDSVALLVCERDFDGRVVSIGKSITMETVEPGLLLSATLELRREAAQKLMDCLWDSGLRPTEGSGSAGALAATQKHLEDMRTLVFKAKNAEPV